jgi:hypothetical protein
MTLTEMIIKLVSTGLQYMCWDKISDKIVVKNPSTDDRKWNDDKIGVNMEDFYAQVVINHSVLKATWKNMKINFVKLDPSK